MFAFCLAKNLYQLASFFHYLLADPLCTCRVNVQAGQTTPCYDPDFHPILGGERNCADTCLQDHRSTSKKRNTESGPDNFGARYYALGYGRFAAPDPVMRSAITSSPQTWNRTCTLDNLLHFVDTDGKYTEAEGGLVRA